MLQYILFIKYRKLPIISGALTFEMRLLLGGAYYRGGGGGAYYRKFMVYIQAITKPR